MDFDDSMWSNVVICRSPGGILMDIPYVPIRIIRRIDPVTVNGNVYDFGENLSGWLSVKVAGKSGDILTIKYSERISSPDKVDQYSVNFFTDFNEGHCDKYICRGDKEEYPRISMR